MPDLLNRFPAKLLDPIKRIAGEADGAGGRAIIVGGSVRDALLKEEAKDVDLEISGLKPDTVRNLLSKHYGLDEYGKSFGVIKLKGLPIEVAMPRTENKVGTGHRGFDVDVDPHLPFPAAAARRDFTINAIGLDPLSGKIHDPWKGRQDLEKGILRHVGPAFVEDPLRVLRGMHFVARLNLVPAPETVELCKTIGLESIPKERILEEWKKLILKGKKISLGLEFLKETNWLRFFPDLERLVDCPQDPEWHPEGDVWTHTLHCMDAFAERRIGDNWEDLIVGFAVLCHDLGKPLTTITDDNGRIRSPKHESIGEKPTLTFLEQLTDQKDFIEQVVPLVRRHLAPFSYYRDGASDSAIRRLAGKVGRIDRLVRVAEADMAGRPPKSKEFPAGEWLLERAEELRVKDAAPQRIVLGRHLIERGMQPGPSFSPILEECFEAQLDGAFNDLDGGLAHLNLILKRISSDV